MNQKKSIAIIGGGAATLMLACSLDADRYNIFIYEKNTALARKFLVAGKGGFNLTHSEDLLQFVERYHPKDFIKPFINHFSNIDFRDWLKTIGIETYVGTSKRVFPTKGIKPIEVLNAIENVLEKKGVVINYNHTWQGWSNGQLIFQTPNNQTSNIKADIVVFALGGKSWKVTGSDGSWTKYFNEKTISTKTFYPSNCAYKVEWSPSFIKKYHGTALKNCEFTCGDSSRKGEAVITEFGIEGSGIYPLSFEIRKQLMSHPELVSGSHGMLNPPAGGQHDGIAKLHIDFKPDLSLEEIRSRLENRGKSSIQDILEKRINLPQVQIELLKLASSKEEYNDVNFLSQLIKSYPLGIVDVAPIDDAISTVGGIDLKEVNANLELKKLPHHYCIGEMLDWDAPTGGYLLQACFSMGRFLADKLNGL